MQRNILKKEVEYPEEMDPNAAAFIKGLITRDATARLGAGASGTADVKAALFFSPLDFSAVEARQV